MSDTKDGPNKVNLKRALCYIPIVAIIFFVVEKGNKDLELDIRYWVMLFLFWFVISIIAWILNVGFMAFLLYLGGSWYLGFKAYNGEKIKLDFLDQAYDAINAKKEK